jgi:hypothetical protein
MTREKFPRLAEDPPRIRAVACYYQSIEDPFVFSVGQQRQAIQEWAAEHDIEIMREFSQGGRTASRNGAAAPDEYPAPVGRSMLPAESRF